MEHRITATSRRELVSRPKIVYRVHCSCGAQSSWSDTRPAAVRNLTEESGCRLVSAVPDLPPGVSMRRHDGLTTRQALEAAGFAVLMVSFIYVMLFLAAMMDARA